MEDAIRLTLEDSVRKTKVQTRKRREGIHLAYSIREVKGPN